MTIFDYLNALPISFNEPSHVFTTCCCYAKRSPTFILTDFAALIISVSSMNENPAISKDNCVRHDIISSPYPLSRIIVNKIALIITHIVGSASFRKFVSIDMPNTVLISCVVDCRVFFIENAAFWISPIRCNTNDAIHKTIQT